MFMFDVLTANGANTGNTLATRDATLQPTNYQNITNSFFPKNVKQDFFG
jgi:hypothetical protein